VAAALEHAVSAHGYRGSDEFRLVLRAAAKAVAAKEEKDHPLFQRAWNQKNVSGDVRSDDIMVL
jgi:hypothetical protein